MESKDNPKFNSKQHQPLSEEVESVTQNEHVPDQKDSEYPDDNPVDKQDEDSYDGDQDTEEAYHDDQKDHYDDGEIDIDKEKQDTSHIDYSQYTRQQLVDRLKTLDQSNSITNVKKEVDIIKATFYKKQRAENDEKKKKFISEGGAPEDFNPDKEPIEQELKDLLKGFKEKKAAVNKSIEDEKKKNLEKKYEIIEELKNLINKKESLGQTFREFRDLQQRWKDTGPVPQNKIKDLWGTYHHHVEKFYDYVKINKELRDLDLKKNLEAKQDLCEKAEQLQDYENIVQSFNFLQDLHAQWREIGPVPNDKKEEIWERFKEATRVINKRHQEYFKELRKKQNENLEAKNNLCQQAEEIVEMEITSHKDWNQYTRKILELQKEWRTIGFAPKKHNNSIYRRFRKACDRFFAQKRVFYAQHKEWQENNLKKKQEFVARAEELKDSTDWENTEQELIRLQKQWKEIGPVPRKHSDDIWNRFRAACDNFFHRKKQQKNEADKDFDVNLKLKKQLIEKIRNFKPSDNTKENMEQLQKYEDEWTSIGFVPFKYKDKIQQEYREAIYEQYDNLNIDPNKKELLKYQSKLKNIKQKPKAESRMYQEREKFINKIEKLESNIIRWENNLGFISAESTEANNMIHDYENKIKNARNEMDLLEEKVKMIDKLDTEEN